MLSPAQRTTIKFRKIVRQFEARAGLKLRDIAFSVMSRWDCLMLTLDAIEKIPEGKHWFGHAVLSSFLALADVACFLELFL